MKKRKEFLALKKCCRYLDDLKYPGYPFAICGIIDFKTLDCYVDNHGDFVTDPSFHKFSLWFEAGLLYNILDSDFTRKGSFVVDSYMADYKIFLEEKWQDEEGRDQFFIDNQELVRLYFAVYAAIRQYKSSEKILFFSYDGDSEWVDVQVFDNLEEINQFYETYFLGE